VTSTGATATSFGAGGFLAIIMANAFGLAASTRIHKDPLNTEARVEKKVAYNSCPAVTNQNKHL
jgi:hypothetical protein